MGPGDGLTGGFDGDVTIGRAMSLGAGRLKTSQTARLDSKVLLKHVLETDDVGLIARSNELLSAAAKTRFAQYLIRRDGGEPVAYITGVKEFWSLEFEVSPAVLIPREDSECLIEAAIERRPREAHLRILDLGTGSGCLLCALLSAFPASTAIGVDRSDAAIALARTNAARLGLSARASFLRGDWFAPVDGKFDIIITNPPYIREVDRAALPRDVGEFEPDSALFAGADGLDGYRAIAAQLDEYLAPGGLFICEFGADQAGRVSELFSGDQGGSSLFTIFDLERRARGIGRDHGPRDGL